MLSAIEERVEFLKQVQIFNELGEAELAEVAERLKPERYAQGAQIFEEGAPGDKMYIVATGKARVTRVDENTGETLELALFDMWDIFGQDALYSGLPRSATVTAFTSVDLLYLDTEDFAWLLDNFPQIEPYLSAFSRTHDLVSQFDVKWLGEGEYIHLITRRHPIRLLQEIFWILVTIMVIALFLVFASYFLRTLGSLLTVFWVVGLGAAGIGLLAVIYAYYEWRNDFFFVTNIRVVWRERILFRSTSR